MNPDLTKNLIRNAAAQTKHLREARRRQYVVTQRIVALFSPPKSSMPKLGVLPLVIVKTRQ